MAVAHARQSGNRLSRNPCTGMQQEVCSILLQAKQHNMKFLDFPLNEGHIDFLITRASKRTPELKFRLFCVQSQIALKSLKRMRNFQL